MKKNNPIQERINQLLLKWTDAVNTPGVKIVRILSESDEQDMIETFFEFMLGIDTEQEDFVMIFNTQYSNLENYAKELLEEIEEEIDNWNNAEVPEELNFETIEWKPDYTLRDNENPAKLFIDNMNSFANYLIPDKDIKVSLVLRMFYIDKRDAYQWLNYVLALKMETHLVLGIYDTEKFTIYDKISRKYPEKVKTIIPALNMDEAVEQLAAGVDPNSEESKYRLYLVKLMNAVKNRKEKEVQELAKSCLEFALKSVKNDPLWLAQIVTIYSILYNDQIGYKNYDDAIYFAGKAVEAGQMTKGVLDPSMAYRLVGQTHLGRGTLFNLKKKRAKALDDYKTAESAYAFCKDYLMQCESLRLCGWMAEKLSEREEALNYYLKAYKLKDNLTPEMLVGSTFPLIIKKLLNNNKREKYLPETQMDKELKPLFGENWFEVVENFGKIPNENPTLAELE